MVTCEKCKKEIEVEHGDLHYPNGKTLGVFGFDSDIWLCYDCNKSYMQLFEQGGTDYNWKKLKELLKPS